MTTKYERLIRRIRQDDRLFTDDAWMTRAHYAIDKAKRMQSRKARTWTRADERRYQAELFIRS